MKCTRSVVLSISALLLAFSVSAQAVLPSEYQARRDELARVIGPAGVFIALSPEPVTRNGSVEWPFRQDDDLKYLTGIDERQTALVILPAEKDWRDMIFTRPFDASAELWTGPIPTTDEVKALSGVTKVQTFDSFERFIPALFGGKAS